MSRVNRRAARHGRGDLPNITSPSYGARSRYQQLENSMDELKMKQRRRRINGAAAASSRRRKNGTGKIDMSLMPLVTRGSKTANSGTVSKNQETTLPRFDEKQEKARRAHLDHVRALKGTFLKASTKHNNQTLELKDARAKLKDLRITLDGITGQDKHLTKERAVMIQRLDKLVADEFAILLKVANQTRYTKVLKNMMWRLWSETKVQSRTLDAYYRLLQLREQEEADFESLTQQSFKDKCQAEHALDGAKATILEEQESFQRRTKELKNFALEREQLMKKAEDESRKFAEEEKRIKDAEKASTVVTTMQNKMTNSRLRDLNQHAQAHQSAFRKILIATGLQEESEIIERWHNRDKYLRDVEEQVERLQKRLTDLTNKNQEFTAHLQEGKFKPETEISKNRGDMTEELENKKATMRRLRERVVHYHKKMIDINQTVDSSLKSLVFVHQNHKYKPSALELELQNHRERTNDDDLRAKVENMQQRVGFLVETLFPDTAHPRGDSVDEENTSEIDPSNPRFYIYWNQDQEMRPQNSNGEIDRALVSENDASPNNVRVLPTTDQSLEEEYLHIEGDDANPLTRHQMKKRALSRFRKETKVRSNKNKPERSPSRNRGGKARHLSVRPGVHTAPAGLRRTGTIMSPAYKGSKSEMQ